MILNHTVQTSEQLLLAVKMEEPTLTLVTSLEELALSQLKSDLEEDNTKKAFWINIYNAYFQILRKEKGIEKSKIYVEKLISITGLKLSLDDIEHGILRRYRYKFSLGYLPNPFAKAVIKKLAVSTIDFRIHFALNCGAKSCPPIAFYSADKIDSQLEMATLSFLEAETDVFENKKEIHITTLFKWFLGDFGGKAGIKKILNEKLNIDASGFKLIFKPYSWEEQLDNYA
jgi:hypothetical protein